MEIKPAVPRGSAPPATAKSLSGSAPLRLPNARNGGGNGVYAVQSRLDMSSDAVATGANAMTATNTYMTPQQQQQILMQLYANPQIQDMLRANNIVGPEATQAWLIQYWQMMMIQQQQMMMQGESDKKATSDKHGLVVENEGRSKPSYSSSHRRSSRDRVSHSPSRRKHDDRDFDSKSGYRSRYEQDKRRRSSRSRSRDRYRRRSKSPADSVSSRSSRLSKSRRHRGRRSPSPRHRRHRSRSRSRDMHRSAKYESRKSVDPAKRHDIDRKTSAASVIMVDTMKDSKNDILSHNNDIAVAKDESPNVGQIGRDANDADTARTYWNKMRETRDKSGW